MRILQGFCGLPSIDQTIRTNILQNDKKKVTLLVHVPLLMKGSKCGRSHPRRNLNTVWVIAIFNNNDERLVHSEEGKNVAKTLKIGEPLMSGQGKL